MPKAANNTKVSVKPTPITTATISV